MPIHDSLQRFLFEHAPIRGEIVHLDATWQAVLERRAYPLPVQSILGELMAAAALLTSTLKFEGRLIMQVQGNGPISLLVVECTSNRTMRAIAKCDTDVAAAPLSELLGDGRMVVTIDPLNGKEQYQAIVNLEGHTVAEAFEHYFATSEQLETRLWLASDPHKVAGLLLQRLPGDTDGDTDAWNRAVHLGSTVRREELLDLPVADIIHRLYHEEDIRLFSRVPVSFRCTCNRERVENVLRMLGHEEIRSILAEHGSVHVDCEFCGNGYTFDQIDAEQLFASSLSTPAANTRH